jgi:hypothetical protein
MIIEEERNGNLRVYKLKEGDDELQIDVSPGKEWVAYVKSNTFDFLDMVDESGSREQVQKTLEETLDLETEGETQVAGVFPDEFSIVLFEGSKLYAGEKWQENGKQLHPEEKHD